MIAGAPGITLKDTQSPHFVDETGRVTRSPDPAPCSSVPAPHPVSPPTRGCAALSYGTNMQPDVVNKNHCDLINSAVFLGRLLTVHPRARQDGTVDAHGDRGLRAGPAPPTGSPGTAR